MFEDQIRQQLIIGTGVQNCPPLLCFMLASVMSLFPQSVVERYAQTAKTPHKDAE